jgi:hypothetical protein
MADPINLSDRELGDMVAFMQRQQARVKGRGMPELDKEVAWWIAKGQALLQSRLGKAVIDPGPQPPVVLGGGG